MALGSRLPGGSQERRRARACNAAAQPRACKNPAGRPSRGVCAPGLLPPWTARCVRRAAARARALLAARGRRRTGAAWAAVRAGGRAGQLGPAPPRRAHAHRGTRIAWRREGLGAPSAACRSRGGGVRRSGVLGVKRHERRRGRSTTQIPARTALRRACPSAHSGGTGIGAEGPVVRQRNPRACCACRARGRRRFASRAIQAAPRPARRICVRACVCQASRVAAAPGGSRVRPSTPRTPATRAGSRRACMMAWMGGLR